VVESSLVDEGEAPKQADEPLAGVFATRSPARPNPIGLHRVELVAVSGGFGDPRRLRVDALEALAGTPILDVKPVLAAESGLR
jgi:tRNA (Thr-GGU) A37 N-methylase